MVRRLATEANFRRSGYTVKPRGVTYEKHFARSLPTTLNCGDVDLIPVPETVDSDIFPPVFMKEEITDIRPMPLKTNPI